MTKRNQLMEGEQGKMGGQSKESRRLEGNWEKWGSRRKDNSRGSVGGGGERGDREESQEEKLIKGKDGRDNTGGRIKKGVVEKKMPEKGNDKTGLQKPCTKGQKN